MVETTTIQVWPSGDMVRYVPNGNEFFERPLLAPREWADTSTPTRPMTDDEWRALRVALRAERIMREDVLTCQTGLVEASMRSGEVEGFEWDDVESLYPDPERMTAAEMRAYVEERGGEVPEVPEMLCHECDGHGAWIDSTLYVEKRVVCATCKGSGVTCTFDDADDDEGYLDALREAVRDCAEPAEVYEWWLVSGWLCGRLREVGEVVLDNGYGAWWGRQGTGQAIIMDGVLQRVAERMEG